MDAVQPRRADKTLFERADARLKHWEGYFEGLGYSIWYGGHGGEPLERLTWALPTLGRLERMFTRGRALLYLGVQRGREAVDANCFEIPIWLENFMDARPDGDPAWKSALRRVVTELYYALGDTQWTRRFYVGKAALCLVVGRVGSGDYDTTIDGLAAWDVRRVYSDDDYTGRTLDVGKGLLRNWWFGLGSL